MTTYDIRTLGQQPIDGALPAGSDVRDDPLYEAMEAEVAKLSSPIHSASIQWDVVTQLCTELLATKGKDLMVACYLTGGLYETRSLRGLAEGLTVIADLLQTYWDTLYPPIKRIRGRRNAVQWLMDRLQQRASEPGWTSLSAQDPDLLKQLQSSLQAIEQVLMEKDSDGPSVRPLVNLIKILPAVEVTAPVEKMAQKPGAEKPGADPVAAHVLNSEEQAGQALDDVCARIVPIAEWLLDAEQSNPLPYRLNRLAAWTPINVLPPETNRQTQIPGPISQLADILDKLKTTQANDALLRFAEAQLAVCPFWIDLNCVCAAALGRLGAPFEAARREVCGETGRLLARLPGLEKLSFASGMPFADGDTLNWLASLNSGTPDSDALSRGPHDERATIAVAVGNARALAAGDNLQAAASCLQEQIAQTQTAKDQLFLQIRLCELLLEHRPGAALKAFAQGLVASIERHDLAVWDPALALDGLQVAYGVMIRNEDDQPSAEALLKRIIVLDANAAVRLVV